MQNEKCFVIANSALFSCFAVFVTFPRAKSCLTMEVRGTVAASHTLGEKLQPVVQETLQETHTNTCPGVH